MNTTDNFRGGKIVHYIDNWRCLTSDPWILQTVQGNVIELQDIPLQFNPPPPLGFCGNELQAVNNAVREFLDHHIIEPCTDSQEPCFYSNIFPRIKHDGTARIILNLKRFNLHLEYIHFKMETMKDVINLIYQNCYFATIDLKHAYFSVPIVESDRRWLRFIWNGTHYQFACLPQGLTSAPRIFTKLMKPVFAHLRSRGYVVLCYIDDCIFIAPSKEELNDIIQYALCLFDSLGLTSNLLKSSLVPNTQVEFLGFHLNSCDMTITLTDHKQTKIKNMAVDLLKQQSVTIRQLASFIGNVVAATLAVPLAPLRYKYLEIERNRALAASKGNYDFNIQLSPVAKDLIQWWVDNIHTQSETLTWRTPDFELFTDASLSGWGAALGDTTTGGHWAQEEVTHINFLELKAIYLALQSLCSDVTDVHIRIRTDNTTAMACIERCSSTKPHLLTMTEHIFNWASTRRITLSAAYIPGVENVDADTASRCKNTDTEWMLSPTVFSRLCRLFGTPKMDLFASRLNAQLPVYASWHPDPHAQYTNAFTINWNDSFMYAFPPFSVIGPVLQKLLHDSATILLIVPLWPTRTWFARALQLLVDHPRLLPRKCLSLPQDPTAQHPLANKLTLAAMLLSADPSRRRTFHQTLQHSSSTPGVPELLNNMGRISQNGCHFRYNNRLIHFRPL